MRTVTVSDYLGTLEANLKHTAHRAQKLREDIAELPDGYQLPEIAHQDQIDGFKIDIVKLESDVIAFRHRLQTMAGRPTN